LLNHLSISNYALIENLHVDFFEGFSVITGETGAGKSIILGALSLIMGQRADVQTLMDKSKKCVVEGIFDVLNLGIEDFFVQNELDFQDHSILRREILPNGKSRAFINDTPVNLNILDELAEKLLDIHSQHKTITLGDVDFQMQVVDELAGNAEILENYHNKFSFFNKLTSELDHLKTSESKARAEQDFIKFQFDELHATQLKPYEQEEIENELKILSNAEEIKTRLGNSVEILTNDSGLLTTINNLINELKRIKSYYGEVSGLFERLEINSIDLKDISTELVRLEEKVEVDPDRAAKLIERINLIYLLQTKHKVADISGLIKVKDECEKKLNDYSSLEIQIKKVEQQLKDLSKELYTEASLISSNREKIKDSLEKHIVGIIVGLGMPRGQFRVEIEKSESIGPNGLDRVKFLFNANQGGELREISKVASGGELSRLMLAVKSLVASKKYLSTIIFDEIDIGVSGEIAGRMGAIMQEMAKNMQIIAITHLPQIAARGQHHYLVYKESDDKNTKTFLKKLPEAGRISEIAKMLSDTRVSESAMETARELLNN
jgi:DNA repair protein RecN (Recombination protein N)